MKHILMANIGNRNIKYLNQGYKNDFIPNDTFRSKTEYILKNFEQERELLEINILNPLLEVYKNEENRLVLFATNQKKNNTQDTCFEAEILKRLIEEKYKNIEVVLQTMECNPTHENELIMFYKRWLQRLQAFEGETISGNYIYFDAGGTSQQKNSLRAVLEFAFPQKRLQQFYGAKDGQKTKLIKLERTASEELKLKAQIKTVLNAYNYRAVKELSKSITTNNPYNQTIDIGISAWDNLLKDIPNFQQLCKSLKKDIGSNTSLKNLLFPTEGFTYPIQCKILLHKFHAQKKQHQYSQAVLTLHQLLEKLVRGLLSKVIEPNLLQSDNYNRDSRQVLDTIMAEYGDAIRKEFNDKEPHSLTFPIQLIYLTVKAETNKTDKNFIEVIKAMNSTFKQENLRNNESLDVLRNGIAHNGKGVSEAIFNGKIYQTFFKKVDTYFGYQKEVNVFDALNQLIIGDL